MRGLIKELLSGSSIKVGILSVPLAIFEHLSPFIFSAQLPLRSQPVYPVSITLLCGLETVTSVSNLNLALSNQSIPHQRAPNSFSMVVGEIRAVNKVSFKEHASKQPQLHNRWHPDIPFAGSIKNGETLVYQPVKHIF